MKIIAIDPGYERLGVAILDKPFDVAQNRGNKEELIFSTCIQTDKALPHSERLVLIKKSLEEILEKYKPEVLAIETLFFNKNQKTVMAVSEARGTIITTCASKGLGVKEFSPLQIKMAVTGNGRSDKVSVEKMVPLLIDMEKFNKSIDKEKRKKKKEDDEIDAIAVGLTYFAMQKYIKSNNI